MAQYATMEAAGCWVCEGTDIVVQLEKSVARVPALGPALGLN